MTHTAVYLIQGRRRTTGRNRTCGQLPTCTACTESVYRRWWGLILKSRSCPGFSDTRAAVACKRSCCRSKRSEPPPSIQLAMWVKGAEILLCRHQLVFVNNTAEAITTENASIMRC